MIFEVPSEHWLASGIYRIRNTRTGVVYIGSTSCFIRRFHSHNQHLLESRHHNYLLQAAYKKNGAESFVFQIIKLVPDKTQLLKEEAKALAKIITGEYYNIAPISEPGKHKKKHRIPKRILKNFQKTKR